MSRKSWHLSRRQTLRGLGASMALPLMEAMVPLSTARAATTGAVGVDGQPVRFAGFFMPNGVDHSRFTPKRASLSELPPILQPLAGIEDYMNVITGLENPEGGHAAGTSAFLTGMVPKRTTNANEVNVKNPSIDQLIGDALRETTVLPTLELGTHTPKSGISMSGHSQIYLSFVSWKNASTPVPPEIDPLRAFHRLFKNARVTGTAAGKKGPSVPAPDASVLDIVLDDAKSLQRRLGKADQQKLDEYLTAVREIEQRVANASESDKNLRITSDVLKQITMGGQRIKKAYGGSAGASIKTVPNLPYEEHIRLQLEVLALAFWSNTTRSASFMFGDGLNGRNMTFLDGVDGSHHSCSHHGDKPKALEMFSKINTFFVGEYANFLKRLESMQEGSSNVLENSVCLFGSNLSSGQQHGGSNMPAIVGGHAGGSLRGNRHIEADGAPIGDLHRSILREIEVDGDIGDGNDRLRGFT